MQSLQSFHWCKFTWYGANVSCCRLYQDISSWYHGYEILVLFTKSLSVFLSSQRTCWQLYGLHPAVNVCSDYQGLGDLWILVGHLSACHECLDNQSLSFSQVLAFSSLILQQLHSLKIALVVKHDLYVEFIYHSEVQFCFQFLFLNELQNQDPPEKSCQSLPRITVAQCILFSWVFLPLSWFFCLKNPLNLLSCPLTCYKLW